MDININIITPVGNLDDLEETILSVNDVCTKLIDFQVRLLLVLNNNTNFKLDGIIEFNQNLKVDIFDISPIASRSHARNFALDKINFKQENSFTIFLDAGDKLLYHAINNLKKYKKDFHNDDLLFIAQSYIQIKNKNNLRKIPLYPIFLRKIVNPFLLGGVIINSKLAKKVKFYEGRKEDWVYWNQVLDLKPLLIKFNYFNYIYRINDINQHYKNKYKSILELRKILVSRFEWGRLMSIPIYILHSILITLRWIYLSLRTNI